MRYFIYLLLMVSTSLSAGTIHKWIDENGSVHYGDAPPVSVKSEDIRVQSKPSNTGKALPRLNKTDDDKQAAAADNNSPNQKLTNEQAKVSCEIARQDLDVISRSARVRLKQPDGSSRYLTEAEIAQRKSQAEADVKTFCK
jgi:hypothetical protein